MNRQEFRRKFRDAVDRMREIKKRDEPSKRDALVPRQEKPRETKEMVTTLGEHMKQWPKRKG